MADARQARVLALHAEGLSYRRIEEVTGINRGTICRWVKAAGVGCSKPARSSAPIPPEPVAPSAPTAGPEPPDSTGWRTFLNVLQVLGRVDIAAAVAKVDEAQLALWKIERRAELEHARATVALRNARVWHSIATTPGAADRDRIAAVDRIQQWAAADHVPALDANTAPPAPVLPTSGPSATHDTACADGACTGRCPAGRWRAWLDRVCWARSQPGATDLIALRSAGELAEVSDVADWLEAGREDLVDDVETPAAGFAIRWAAAVGDSVGSALAAHAAALAAGAGAATRAALDTLAAIAPDEYGGRGDPRRFVLSPGGEPVARILEAIVGHHTGKEPRPDDSIG